MSFRNEDTSNTLDPSSWAEKYGEYLLHFALGKVRNYTIAEDLVQETYLAAWKARKRFAGRAAERTWLTRILLNKIADHYRSAARKPSVLSSQLSPDDDSDNAVDALNFSQNQGGNPDLNTPGTAAEHAEFARLLERALQTLPEQTASAFRMREIQGMSTQDITSRLNITPNHLWVLIHRARKALRQQLEAIWETNSLQKAMAN